MTDNETVIVTLKDVANRMRRDILNEDCDQDILDLIVKPFISGDARVLDNGQFEIPRKDWR